MNRAGERNRSCRPIFPGLAKRQQTFINAKLCKPCSYLLIPRIDGRGLFFPSSFAFHQKQTRVCRAKFPKGIRQSSDVIQVNCRKVSAAIWTRLFTTPNSKDSPNLDLLRAIAVSCVLLSHLTWSVGYSEWGSLGRFGVVLFFVHTSYVLMASLDRSQGNISSFAIRRFFRIYPLAALLHPRRAAVTPPQWSAWRPLSLDRSQIFPGQSLADPESVLCPRRARSSLEFARGGSDVLLPSGVVLPDKANP